MAFSSFMHPSLACFFCVHTPPPPQDDWDDDKADDDFSKQLRQELQKQG